MLPQVPVSPTWILIYVLAFVFLWIPIGLVVFRHTVLGHINRMLRSPGPTPTEGERKLIQFVAVPLLIIAWPAVALFWFLAYASDYALDDRHHAIRQLKNMPGLPGEEISIKFMEDLQRECQVPHSELLKFMNDLYAKYKDERGWY